MCGGMAALIVILCGPEDLLKLLAQKQKVKPPNKSGPRPRAAVGVVIGPVCFIGGSCCAQHK